MGMLNCYDMRLYCDHPDHKPHDEHYEMTFTGTSYRDSLRQAKRAGWTFTKRKDSPNGMGSGFALCPDHSGVLKPKNEGSET